jgi:hypothetical protein
MPFTEAITLRLKLALAPLRALATVNSADLANALGKPRISSGHMGNWTAVAITVELCLVAITSLFASSEGMVYD